METFNSWDPLGESSPEEENDNAAMMVVEIFVCIVGVIGNVLVIFVIIGLGEYKKAVTHWYVLQLAVADSIFLLTLPFKVVEQSRGQWIFSGGMCKAKEAILFFNYYSSILFLMVLSIDRYIAVCHVVSARLQRLRTNFSAYTITAIVWVVSFCLCTPATIYSDKYGIDPKCKCLYEFPTQDRTADEMCQNMKFLSGEASQICSALSENESKCRSRSAIQDMISGLLNISELDTSTTALVDDYSGDYEGGTSNTSEQGSGGSSYEYETSSGTVYQAGCTSATSGAGWKAYILFNFIVMFLIPFVAMSACYLLIALRLRKAQMRLRSRTNEESSTCPAEGKNDEKRHKSAASTRTDRNRIRVTCVCLALVSLFLVCWLPFHSVHLAKIKGIVGSSRFCEQLSAVVSLLAYSNSALNPYVYNFVGTNFIDRLRSAGASVGTIVRNRTSALSSAGEWTARYKSRKRGVDTSASDVTAATKISKGKSDVDIDGV